MRSELAGATKKGLDYARDTGRDFSERATDYYETGIERASDISDRSRDAINEMADRGRDLINRQKAQFAAAIDAGKQGLSRKPRLRIRASPAPLSMRAKKMESAKGSRGSA
ncbi:MAG: hypothetical protein IPL01_17475 [Acidobacteria bacterium]|nr:hypothetical protein [Acidobacteriota bacterium]